MRWISRLLAFYVVALTLGACDSDETDGPGAGGAANDGGGGAGGSGDSCPTDPATTGQPCTSDGQNCTWDGPCGCDIELCSSTSCDCVNGEWSCAHGQANNSDYPCGGSGGSGGGGGAGGGQGGAGG